MLCDLLQCWVVSQIIGEVIFELCCGNDYLIFNMVLDNLIYKVECLIMEKGDFMFIVEDCIGQLIMCNLDIIDICEKLFGYVQFGLLSVFLVIGLLQVENLENKGK